MDAKAAAVEAQRPLSLPPGALYSSLSFSRSPSCPLEAEIDGHGKLAALLDKDKGTLSLFCFGAKAPGLIACSSPPFDSLLPQASVPLRMHTVFFFSL